MKTKTVVLITILSLFALLVITCKKDDNGPDLPPSNDKLSIDSITTTSNVLKAWIDTAIVRVHISGDVTGIVWEADHGSIFNLNGFSIQYFAGECCVGHNTITCKVYDSTSTVADTIMIRVKSYSDTTFSIK